MIKSRIIEKLKEIKKLKNDGDIAKLLGIGKTALSDHKRRGTLPYHKIINYCIKEGISLDEVFLDKTPKPITNSFTDMISESFTGIISGSESSAPYGTVRFNELCKKLEKILFKGSLDEKAKVMGIIEALYDDLDKQETEYKEAESTLKRIQKPA